MVIACLTMSWALILLNKYKVVIHATNRVEFTLFSADKETQMNFNVDLFRLELQYITEIIVPSL